MINLTRTSKKTGISTIRRFEDIDKLEDFLKTLSTTHHANATYEVSTVHSQYFEVFKRDFIEKYNPEYYTIDNLLGTIKINIIRVGQRRVKKRKPKFVKSIDIFTNALNRINAHKDLRYDEILNQLDYYPDDEDVITFELSNDKQSIVDIKLNGNSFEKLREGMRKSYDIRKQIESFQSKMKREP